MKALYLKIILIVILWGQLSYSQVDNVVTKEVMTINSSQSSKMIDIPIWDKISIRRSFETKTENDEKAATFSFTFPKDKDNVFNINAGIGYTFAKLGENKNQELNGFFVYNKNNQIDKRQENYKIGVSQNFIWFTESGFGLIDDNSLEYLNDNSKKSQSLLALAYLSFRTNSGTIVLESYAARSNMFAYKLLPKVGLEYQNNYDVSTPLQQGYYLRSYFNIGGSSLIKKRTYVKTVTTTVSNNKSGEVVKSDTVESNQLLDKMYWTKGLELTVNYEGRNNLLDNFDNNPNYTHLLKGELKIYPISDTNFSFSLTYTKGETPLDGLEKQEFWMLSLNFKK